MGTAVAVAVTASTATDGHSHNNLADLDKIRIDSDGYARLSGFDADDAPVLEKIKAGYADSAYDLTTDSPTRHRIDNFISGVESLFVPVDSSGNDLPWSKATMAEALKAKVSLYSLKQLSAKGPYGGGDGSSGGTGGGASYDRYDGTWGDYTTAFDAYVVSGKSGKALYDRTVTNYNSISALSGRMSAVESNRIKVDGSNGTHAGVSELVQALYQATGTVTDSMEFVTSNVDPTATRLFYRRPASSIWAYVKAKADSVYQAKGDYARLKSSNDLVHRNNEITMVPSGYAGNLWLNYRTCGGTDGSITSYNMGNGGGGYAKVIAASFCRAGGTSAQFLKADGSVDSNTYALSSALGNYLPLTGGTLLNGSATAPLNINTASTTEVGMRFQMSTNAKGWMGYHPAHGVNLYNYTCNKYFGIKDDGTLHFGGNTVWHAGNDGAGSGLDADLLDGIHAGHQRGQIPVWRDFGSYSGVNNGDTGDESNYRNFLKRITGSSQYGSKIDGPNFMGTLTPNSQRFVIGSVYAADAYKDGYPQYAYFLSIPLLNNPRVFGTNGGVYYEKTLAFTTDNVASATKLQTARTLWGQSFDGTGNVSGSLSDVGGILASGVISTSSNICAGGSLSVQQTDGKSNLGLSLYGSANNVPNYGILFAKTSHLGTCNHVSGDWATYFTMAGADNRGWIFRNASSGTNVASISNAGYAYFVKASIGTISTDSLRIGDAVLTWDSSAKMLKVSTGLYSEGQVSGKGPGNSSAGSGGGSGSLFGLMKSWPSSDPGTGTTDALGANLGWELFQTKLSKTEAQTLYQPKGDYVTRDTTQTVSGAKTFSNVVSQSQNNSSSWWLSSAVRGKFIATNGGSKDGWSPVLGFKTLTGKCEIGSLGDTCYINYYHDTRTANGVDFQLTLPKKSGTLAVTSDIPTSMAWSAITGKPTTLGGYGITDAVTIDTDQFVKGRKMFLGAVDFRMNTDTSNAVAMRWIKTDGSTAIANICYHNTAQRLIFNPVGSSEVWNDKAGNYSLIVGNNELTYNTKAVLREDNYTSYVSTLRDRTNGTATYLNYGASGLTTASWLAAWNGYELRVISPSNVRSVIGAVAKAGDTMTGPLGLQMGGDTKLIFNNTDGEKYTVLSFREADVEYSKITAVENRFIFSKLVDAPYYTANTTTLCTNLNADLLDGVHATGFCRAYGEYSFGGTLKDCTTEEFIDLLKAVGAFNQPYWVARGTWAYANNYIITDTGCGDIQLAGATIEVFGNTGAYHIRISTAPSSSPKGVTNAVFVYRFHGKDYSPGWRRLANTTDNVASATRLQGTYKLWGQNFYGNNVDGAMTINYTGETGIALYRNETGGGAFIRFYNTNQTANYFRMGMFADSRFGIGYNSGTDAINILTNGNVGIGTSAPAYTFDVDGSFRATGDIWFNQWGRITYSSGGWLQLTNGTNHISALNGAQMTQLTVHANTVQTLNGNLQAYNSSTKNSSVVMPGGIELIHGTPYIDFHFGQSTADFTARIIADEDNALRILGGSNFKLKIGNGYIQWDSTLAMFHFSHGIYSDGQVTAKGPASASKSATDLEDSGIALMSDSVPDSEIDALWTEIASLKARVYQLESRLN